MRTNTAARRVHPVTHEGARASSIDAEQQLRRSLLTFLLWEDSFYESGEDIAKRIAGLIPQVDPYKVSQLAVEAREKSKLRHAPLFVAREMLRHPEHKKYVADTLAQVIQRADELGEFLAIYWKDAKIENGRILTPIAAQVKRGLAAAFTKFNAYQLAKYNRSDAAVKLRDVLFLTHPKPANQEQAATWKKLAEGTLKSPDTWEVALSATKGEGKKEEWERLLAENKLGGLALLRNLRNFKQAGVNEKLVLSAIRAMKTERILPFRFITAANYAPQWESELEEKMISALGEFEKLPGKTAIVVDNSGSMYGPKVSAKSELDRADAACALAILVREVCQQAVVIGFGSDAAIVPNRKGFALRDAIKKGPGGGTNTQDALMLAARQNYDRVIVITDEQSHQTISNPLIGTKGYMINVAGYQNGIGYGQWTHIDGWSENVLEYIRAAESQQ